MGKKRVGPDRGPVTTTKVYAEVLKRARAIANHKDITLFDLIYEILVAALDREHAKMLRDLTREAVHDTK
jgi:hypothetical protein